jgi:hypothetical protein
VDELAPIEEAPATLSETGLFVEVSEGVYELAPYVLPFQPKFVLWSDGATKDRYAYIPRCSQIDTSDMDQWDLPVGTRLYKTFTRNNSLEQPVKVETRMMVRYDTSERDWLMVTYAWGANQTDPSTVSLLDNADELPDQNDTLHDIPSRDQCRACHEVLPAHALGFSAFQLSHDLVGENIDTLAEANTLTDPAPQGGYAVPGTATDQAALGYMHANCGHCHNEYNTNTNIPRMQL